MAGTDDPLAPLDLSAEEIAKLIRAQNAKLVSEAEAKRNAPGVDWSQPLFWPLSAGRDEAGELVGLDFTMPEMLKSILSSVTLPADVMEGKVDPMSAEGIQRAAAFPLDVLAGNSPFMVKAASQGIDPNLLSIFAGQNSKTADLDELEKAQRMVNALSSEGKVSPDSIETIFGRTGWFPGPDGKWRYEIPDNVQPGTYLPKDVKIPEKGSIGDIIKSLSALMGEQGDLIGKVPNFMEHPELFEAYPDLRNLTTKVGIKSSQQGVNYHDPLFGIEAYGPTQTDQLSVLLHELQHSVQNIEGFATGGNPEQTKNILSTLAPSADQQLLYPDPYMIYRALMGETEARAVQSRYELGTALGPSPADAMIAEIDQLGWDAVGGKGTGGQFQTSPYYREPGVDPDITGAYDIPFNLQINPAQLRAAQMDGPGSSNSLPLLKKLQMLKMSLAGS